MDKKSNKNLRLFLVILIVLLLTVSIGFIYGIIPTGLVIGEMNITKIAVILTENEVGSIFNDCVSMGVQTAVDDINRLGGINGRRFEIIFENDQNSSDVSRNISIRLADEGVIEIIPVTFIKDLVNVSKEKKFILVSVTHARPLFLNSTYSFQFRDSNLVPMLTMAEVAIKELGLHDIVIIYSDRTIFSKDVFKERFEDLGGTVLLEINFTYGVTNNYTYISEMLKETKPEAVFFSNSIIDQGIYHFVDILKEIRSTGLDFTILSRSIEESMGESSLVELSGNVTEGIIFISHYHTVHPNRYGRQNFGPGPVVNSPCTFQAYEAVAIPAMAMERCGEDVDCISNVLHTSEFDSLTGKIRFGEDGIIIRPYILKVVRNGMYNYLYEYGLLEN